MKKLTPPILIILFSALIFYLENNWGVAGSFINSIWPCTQPIETSFPCYVIVDFWVMGIMGLLFVMGWIWIAVVLIKKAIKKP